MTSPKLIAVVGATGMQGGSVVNTFLDDPTWRVRGLTRNPLSPKAQALAARGVEVVQGDLDQPNTLRAAFQDANAIFLVSDFWGIYNDPKNRGKVPLGQTLNDWTGKHEEQQLKNAIDIAAAVHGLERLVVSSLPDVSKWSHGKYTHVYHFDSKARAVDYGAQTYPELWAKTSTFCAGFFLTNFTTDPISQPVKAVNGHVQFISNFDPDNKIPVIVPGEDTGPLTKALIEGAPGKSLVGYRDWLTPREIASIFSEVTGLEAEVVTLPIGEWRIPLPAELKTEVDDNYAFANEFGLEGRENPSLVHPQDLEHPPHLDSVADWMAKQNWGKVLGEERADSPSLKAGVRIFFIGF